MNLTDDEMRVKIATLMGWEIANPPDIEDGALMGHIRITPNDWRCWDMVPEFTTSVDAALTLCDRLREEGFGVVIVGPSNHGNWFVDFTNKGTIYRSEDPSLARAICLAFLKVQDSIARSP